jgi:hypothetical protein
MRVIAVLPCKGREPLLKQTVIRLLKQCVAVIVAGHTESEHRACNGAEFLFCAPDMPLGAKWQLCIDVAMDRNPDAILIMGSSDMISDNWIPVLYKEIENGYAMVGTSGIHFLDIKQRNRLNLCHWKGYNNYRAGEPIGTGRLISAKALRMMGGIAFDRHINHSLDYSTMEKLDGISQQWGEKLVKCIDYTLDSTVKCLSISTYRWENKHNFGNMLIDSSTTRMENAHDFAYQYFPEVENLFNE